MDLQRDGRPDLVITSSGDEKTTGLLLVGNQWTNDNRFIGVRLDEHGPGLSPHGARLRLEIVEGDVDDGGGTSHSVVHQFVTGDSHSAQHMTEQIFGLGRNGRVEKLEVRWPNGYVQSVEAPAFNTYHEVVPEPRVLQELKSKGVPRGIAAEARAQGLGDGEPTPAPRAGEPGRRRTAQDAAEHEREAHGAKASRLASGRVLGLVLGLLAAVLGIGYLGRRLAANKRNRD
jgi:hypothetical protein